MKWTGGNRFNLLSRGLRRQRGEMNEREAAYAAYLTADPAVFHWWFQPFSLKLSHPAAGRGATYTPDFLVLMQDGTTYCDDTKAKKGFDDKAGVVRSKCAAEQFPLWTFRLVYRLARKDGGGWEKVTL